MQVSVAMATYNGSDFLRQQLVSIAAQTVLPAEIVISDDGSTDDTIVIAKDFGRTAPFPVRVLSSHPRLGFADNFLNAAEHCTHELLMFADQDDVWLPRKLEDSRRRIIDNGSLLAMHALTMVDLDLKPVGHFAQGISGNRIFEPLELDPYLCGYGNTMMFRRELAHMVDRRRRPKTGDKILSHDTWIYTLAAALGKVSHLEASYILYRQHGANLTAIDDRTGFRRLADLATFPVEHHRQMMTFYRELSNLLADADQGHVQWSCALQAAAERYRERAIRIDQRLQLYQRPSIRGRLQAFVAAHRKTLQGQAAAGSSGKIALKDFVVGVLRFGTVA